MSKAKDHITSTASQSKESSPLSPVINKTGFPDSNNSSLRSEKEHVIINNITIDSVEALKKFCLEEYKTDQFTLSNNINDFLQSNKNIIMEIHSDFLNIKEAYSHNAACNLEAIIEQGANNIEDFFYN